MRIDLALTYAGVPALTVRDVLRRAQLAAFDHIWLAERARIDPRRGLELARALQDAGLLEPVAVAGVPAYQCTDRGLAFASARLSTVHRATAERVLAAVLGRAHELNARPDPEYKVASIMVFGSFLDPARDRLGDLDLAVSLGWAAGPGRLMNISQADGRAAWTSSWRFLKGRERTISLTDLASHRTWLEGKPHREVFVDLDVINSQARTIRFLEGRDPGAGAQRGR